MESDLAAMVSTLVGTESPSEDRRAVRAAHEVLDRLGADLLGTTAQWRETDGAPAVAWRGGDPADPRRVLLLGHVDTVWPLGTLARRPAERHDDGTMTGPGVFDMKAGLAIALLSLADLGPAAPVTLLVTGDEEIGSPDSRRLIETEARTAQACLVLEGAADGGAVKSGRKGWSFYTFTCAGVAAHAGLEPHRGVNALVGLADLVGRVAALNDPHRGVSVTPTVARAGTTVNTVPDRAEVKVDVRCPTPEQQEEVDRALRGLVGTTPAGVEISVDGGINRPPMTEDRAIPLLERLDAAAAAASSPPPGHTSVGGISDANLVAALGVPTLDGLGAVGGGAHAEHEWIDLGATAARVPLVTALVRDLLDHPLPSRPATEGPS